MAENASNRPNGRPGSRNGSNASINANANATVNTGISPNSATGTNANRNMSAATLNGLVKELTEVGPELGAATTLAIATAISEKELEKKEKEKETASMEKQSLSEKDDAKIIDETLPSSFEAFEGTVPANWTAGEEQALVRRLDLRIVPLVTLLYLCNFIEVAGLETDLGLVGYQYNIGLSIFYIAYTIVEVPSNLLLKRFGATIWIPTLVLAFGLVCFSTAFVTNFGGFMTLRTTLGLAEGGMMPGVAYYLSTWYKGDELVLRIGLFVSAASISGAFGGLLASAFLSIPQIPHLPLGRWRNVFLIEGALTIMCAFLGYLLLPRSPERANFLTERERSIAVERLARENQGAADDGPIDWALVRRAWFSMTNWMCALCFLLTNISVQGMALFMPSLIAGMGYSTIQTQLLTVPPYFVASIMSILIAWLSQRYSKRGIWILMMLPLAMIGSGMLIGSNNRKVEYAGIFFLASGIFPNGPLFLTWVNNNSAPYTTRAVSSAMVVSIGSLGPLVSSWVYLPKDSPQYITGLSVQLAGQIVTFFIVIFLIMWLHRENRLRQCGRRDWRLDADESIVAKLGHLHPRFKMTI